MSSELKENQNITEAAENEVETTAAAVDTEEFAEETAAPAADTRDFELRISDEKLARKKKFAQIWDKVTTGILILLMASPFAILFYIFLWFVFLNR